MLALSPGTMDKATRVRWIRPKDVSDVLAVEMQSFPDPWTYEQIVSEIRRRDTITMVADLNGRVVGYIVIELLPNGYDVRSLAVEPECRGHGIGRKLVDQYRRIAETGRRRRIVSACVDERNLDAQLFFRSLGFICKMTLADWFEDSKGNDIDAYFFTWKAGESESGK